jgi:hypothetical protein
MERLSKLISLSSADRRLLMKTLLIAGTVRLGLWLLPFRILRHILVMLSKPTSQSQERDPTLVDRVAWAVTVSSRYVPGATCLSRALATKVLLCRRGQAAVLRIGVNRSKSGNFEAHAWVESNGRIIIGGSDVILKDYTSLPPLGEEII